MTLYTAKGCPQCRFLRQKLDEKGIQYEVCENPDEMPALKSIPALQMEDGRILSMRDALKFVSAQDDMKCTGSGADAT